MKVSEFIAASLHRYGVSHVYEVVGGMITRLIDAIYLQGKIELISMHHEQAAAFAADAMGKIKGVPGVAMATSGPGAVNLLTGIGSCFFDSVPAVFITGQVNRDEQKANRRIRQLGFQETNIIEMAKPITKGAWAIDEPAKTPTILKQAFDLAISGRPGPVLLDFPMDVQGAEIADIEPLSINEEKFQAPPALLIEELVLRLVNSSRPLILAGSGIKSGRAISLLRELVDLIHVPVVNSLMAVDVLPYKSRMRFGLIGTYGNRWANLALGKSDFLLVLGSRLDIRQTGADVAAFSKNRLIYHVDIEECSINSRLNGCIPIVSHLRPFLGALLEMAKAVKWPDRREWLSDIQRLRKRWPDIAEVHDVPGINPNALMHSISEFSTSAGAFVVDVGNHQMWAAQSLELGKNQKFITSGGMGAMGYALPAAVGATHATGESVVAIAGDGGMQLNIQELETVSHHQLPIKILVIHNNSLGMVRQFQQNYFDGRYPSTVWGYSAPDFSRIARAYGIKSVSIKDQRYLIGGLKKMWERPREPFLLEVYINPQANAYPKIAFGRPITEMEPFVKPSGFEGT